MRRLQNLLARWFTASNLNLLVRCSRAERKKFFSTGVLVFLITLLTAISSIYTLEEALMPPNAAHDLKWYLYVTLCIFLGTVWTAIVFNLFRFFVATVATNEDVGWSRGGDIAAMAVQIFFCAVLAISLGLPLAVMMLKTQIDFEGKAIQRSKINEISMVVNFHDSHALSDDLEAEYQILSNFQVKEKDEKSRLLIYKDNPEKLESIKRGIEKNSENQAEVRAKIAEIRKLIENDFIAESDTRRSINLIAKARFIWEHNFPITIFMMIFIFLVYTSLIIAKFLLPKGRYEYLVSYENRAAACDYGIVDESNPVVLNRDLVRFQRFYIAEILLQEEIKQTYKSHQLIYKNSQTALAQRLSAAVSVIQKKYPE
jgi:hypothetical protein